MIAQDQLPTRIDLTKLTPLAKRLGYVRHNAESNKDEVDVQAMIDAMGNGELKVIPSTGNVTLQALLDGGIIRPSTRGFKFLKISPLVLDGQPLSEEIIANRR